MTAVARVNARSHAINVRRASFATKERVRYVHSTGRGDARGGFSGFRALQVGGWVAYAAPKTPASPDAPGIQTWGYHRVHRRLVLMSRPTSMMDLAMIPVLRTTFVSLALLAASVASAQAPANATSGGTLLKVSAQGEVQRAPDVAEIGVGVVTQAADAKAALSANAAQMNGVLDAVKRAGIEERDVQTSGVSLQPQYQYGDNQPPKLNGYQASNRVSVKVRDIGEVGDVLDALVAQGANQIDGPTFTLDKPEAALDDARRAALTKARARAGMYAAALGLKVARIVSVDESGSGFQSPRPMMMAKAEMAMDARSTPVMPGEQTHSASLDVVFELR